MNFANEDDAAKDASFEKEKGTYFITQRKISQRDERMVFRTPAIYFQSLDLIIKTTIIPEIPDYTISLKGLTIIEKWRFHKAKAEREN